MTDDIYQRLAKHLDKLPGGFPATESGVELRLLRRLFTPEQAELAPYLTLIPEETRVVRGSNLLLALSYYFLYPRQLVSKLLIF